MKPIAPKWALILGDHPRFLYQLGAGAGLERGTFPSPWITAASAPPSSRKGQVCAYHTTLSILRESGCTSYEKTFPYLFYGKDRVASSWSRSQRDQCRRNSESHGRRVLRPEGPPVDPDLRRAISGARRSYLPSPDARFAGKHSVAVVPFIPGSSADGLRYPAVAHRYRRHRCWRARDLDVIALRGTIPSASPS